MRDLGKKPELAWLPIDKLTVNEAYQRSVASDRSQKLIKKIAAEFDWALFQTIVATPIDKGKRWEIIDGQHRVEAAKRIGEIQHIPAIVVSTSSAAKAAAVFVAANRDRVTVNPLQIHHAMLTAGDTKAVAIRRVCDKAGVELPRNPLNVQNLKPGQTLAVGTIARVIKEKGEEIAASALKVLADAYAGKSGLIRATYLRAVALLLAGDLGGARPAAPIVLALKRHSQTELDLNAHGRYQQGLKSISIALAAELQARTEAAGAVKPEPAPPTPAMAKGQPRTLAAALETLKENGLKIFDGAEAGTYRFGDVDGFSAEDLIDMAGQINAERSKVRSEKRARPIR